MPAILNLHDEVWTILVEECGADDLTRSGFVAHWPACREYRFMGALGFGGKVWSSGGRLYVTCYYEDETPLRAQMVLRANERLSHLGGK